MEHPISTTSSAPLFDLLGPQCPSDDPLRRKARLLQSYIRANKLRLPYGVGPWPSSQKKYGNMLSDGGNNGGNFLTQEIFEYARMRVANKRNEETIDAFRLFNNMLSSMPMCFNMFRPLQVAAKKGDGFVAQVFSQLLPDCSIAEIRSIEIEHAPLPLAAYLNNKTGFDALIHFRTYTAKTGIVAIETKYTDSLGRNNPVDMRRARQVAAEIGCFTDSGLVYVKKRCPQIVRNFLLAEKYRLNNRLDLSHSLVIALRDDHKVRKEVEFFKSLLKAECFGSVSVVAWEDFVDRIISIVPGSYAGWIQEFRKRYLQFESALPFVQTETC